MAATILSDIDPAVEPCEDFYQHACGGWEKLNPIPDGHSSWSMFEKLWEGNQLVMKNALEENFDNKSSMEINSAKEKAHHYYLSCMDPNGTIEDLSGKPLLDLIRTHFKGWSILERHPNSTSPNINDWIPDNDPKLNFTNVVAKLHHEIQSDGFFTWIVAEDDHNSSQHVIQMDQGGLTLPTRDHYLQRNYTQVVEALKKVMYRLMKLLIADSSEEGSDISIGSQWQDKIRTEINQIIDFETRLANITIPASQKKESGFYHRKTIEELNSDVNFLNWTTYFNHAFARVNKTISNSTEIAIFGMEYLSSLNELVEEYKNTSRGRQTLDSYMKWHIIKSTRNALSKPYRDAGKILEKALLGKEGHSERWRECVTDTDTALGFALGAMFVRKVFHGESKKEAHNMISSIKEAFERRIKSLRWMDDTTQIAALTKAEAITNMIGYPSYIENTGDLEAKYQQLNVGPTNFFGNSMAARRFTFNDNMKKLDKLVNRTKWSMTPPTVNAYYTPTKNQIVFPAGIMQSPFFNVKYPKSINFGAMGVVMGHELSHAFDDQGREYDELGNMRDWWNNNTLEQFESRTQCIVNQYSSYTIPTGQNVSGTLTLGENIADNGGLKTAYYAYKSWLAQNQHAKTELPLPGLNHTHDQLFFLSFAQVWCSASTPQAMRLQILEDHHSPARFRVIGVLSNTKEFSDAFNCPIDSPMNPKHKCEVW